MSERIGTAKRALANGRRLRRDAAWLNEGSRHHSAIVLAILAMEELGKAFILSWEVKNSASRRKFPTHIEKQGAVFCVLTANEMLKNRRRVERLRSQETPNLHKVGPYSSQLAWARGGFYDDLRHAATYFDETPKIPQELSRQFGHELVDDLFDYFDSAIKVLRNGKALLLAREIYRNDLGRL